MDAVAIKNTALTAFAAVGTVIAKALGGWDTAIICLFAFMVADYLTGLAVAAWFHNSPKTAKGGASSCAALKGFLKKLFMLLIVAMAELLDRVMQVDFLRTAAVLFFIANEGLSILENGGLMGIKYPKFLKNALEILRDKAEGGTVPTGEDIKAKTPPDKKE